MVRELADRGMPIFGICLGHQILGLALGGETVKLKFGHHGGNQPGQDLATKKVAICAENHGYAVDAASLRAAGEPVEITHVNLNDGTVEGLAHATRPIFSVQYHPEASPGPHDAGYFFGRFREMVLRKKRGEGDGDVRAAVAKDIEMPKRTDIHTILVIGSGPIVIGQACEFDYSGTQACKALREEGYRVDPDQLESRDGDDRSGDGGPHLHRADDGGESREDHRPRPARRAAPDDRRPDRAQPRARSARGGRARRSTASS